MQGEDKCNMLSSKLLESLHFIATRHINQLKLTINKKISIYLYCIMTTKNTY